MTILKVKKINLLVLLVILAVIPLTVAITSSKKFFDSRSRGAASERQLTVSILTSEDDADENADSNAKTNPSDRELHFGWYRKAIGLRFQSIELGQLAGRPIITSFLKMRPSNTSESSMEFTIYGEKSGDCSPFLPSSKNITSRLLTTNRVAWNLTNTVWTPNSVVNSPDLKEIINEIMADPAWQKNNLCFVIIQDFSDKYQERKVFAKEANSPISLSISYLPPVTEVTPTSGAELSTCRATNPNTLRNCFERVNNNSADTIEIVNSITCSGPSACPLAITNVDREIYIRSVSGTNAVIRRNDNFDYNLLTISDSGKIHISNLAFEESINDYCSFESNGTCPGLKSTIYLAKIKDVYFDNVSIKNSRRMAIEIRNSDNFNLRNSLIENSMIFGLWLAPNTKATHIENNIFKNIRSNAILYAGISTASNPGTIIGNQFIHNHRETVFHDANGVGIGGGQMYIAGNTSNLLFKNNIIKEGRQDTDTWQFSGGIEVYFDKVHDVLIANNDIHDNTGPGIYMWGYAWGSKPLNLSNIRIVGNRVYNHPYGNIILFKGATESNNCYTPGCPLGNY